ncbi:MAG: respiratory nitrate reductase subunit gamma [Rhizobiaceae bacterium]
MPDFIHQLLFGVYPYVALAIMILGSIFRYDREPYSWRSGSSQLLRRKQLVWGSILFHIGILFLLFGHAVGLLTPHFIYEHFISVANKQLLAIIAGSVAGIVCFVGISLLAHRRLFDARVSVTSTFSDVAILLILWVQLALGLLTVPYSLQHSDGSVMLRLSEWAQRILTFRTEGTADLISGLAFPYQAHLVLGLTIFLLFPFSRLVHMLSVPVRYFWRPGYQVVRQRNVHPAPKLPAE